VGMLEHVGPPNYDTYFAKLGELLAPGGIALIHTIARLDPPRAQSEWLDRYIFPGGYSPSLSMLTGPIERSGLWTADIEVLRLHYAMTLRHWLTRFRANLEQVRLDHDERFVRMWSFYLIACIVTFEESRQGVLQFQLTREADAVPLTRDYLIGAEAALLARHAAE
jgi:cyclopropane-fatty-acyl-phospholipid synthase